jgi:hypothetical protein
MMQSYPLGQVGQPDIYCDSADRIGQVGQANGSIEFHCSFSRLALPLLKPRIPISGARSMSSDPAQLHGIIAAIVGFYFVVFVVVMVAIILPFWFILKKAGFSPWLSLINIVPFGPAILLYILAFAEWKVVPAPQMTWQPPYPPPPFPPQS